MSPNSSDWGSLTLQMTSPRSQTSEAVAAISAPARRYSSSVMAAPTPAPVSTTTVEPWWMSSDTPSGVTATRYSFVFVSFGTPTTSGWVIGSGTTRNGDALMTVPLADGPP